MKLVINVCEGCFGLSDTAHTLLEAKGYFYRKNNFWYGYSARSNPDLVSVVEKLGPEANGAEAELKVVDITDNICWEILDDLGKETVREVGGVWS